jgi:hypothetical protein
VRRALASLAVRRGEHGRAARGDPGVMPWLGVAARCDVRDGGVVIFSAVRAGEVRQVQGMRADGLVAKLTNDRTRRRTGGGGGRRKTGSFLSGARRRRFEEGAWESVFPSERCDHGLMLGRGAVAR